MVYKTANEHISFSIDRQESLYIISQYNVNDGPLIFLRQILSQPIVIVLLSITICHMCVVSHYLRYLRFNRHAVATKFKRY